MHRILILLILSLISGSAFSQYYKKEKKKNFWVGTYVTPRIGTNTFFGDLVDSGRWGYMLGGTFTKDFKPMYSGRFSINTGRMQGQQILPNTSEPYAYFKNFYIEYNVGMTYRPLDHFNGYFKQRSFNPYVIGEVGLFMWKVREWYGPTGAAANNVPTDSPWPGHSVGYEYNAETNEFDSKGFGFTPNFKLGGGLQYWLKSNLVFNLEVTATAVTTDMLDGHKEWNEPGTDIIHTTDGPIDFYYSTMLGMNYIIRDNLFKNNPKYNRRAYLKTRKVTLSGSKSKKSKFKPPKRRKR